MNLRKYLAELLGTYALVFAGTGAIIVDQQYHGIISQAGVAITFGLVVMSMIYAFGSISGAHINPAVSIAFTVANRLPARDLLPYVIAQMCGACLASITLHLMFPTNELLGCTIPDGSEIRSLVLEFILTFFLMLVILNVATGEKEKGITAGMAIGSVVALEAMFAGPVCGASMNPARSLAPALVSGHLQTVWIYVVAPIAGAICALPVFRLLRG
jgi:aquaporin NIP